VLVVLCVFANTVGGEFLWDDNILMRGIPTHTQFDLSLIFFGLANGVEYLPIRDITYATDFWLWGDHSLAGCGEPQNRFFLHWQREDGYTHVVNLLILTLLPGVAPGPRARALLSTERCVRRRNAGSGYPVLNSMLGLSRDQSVS
jgi:hypothetical protein